MPACRPAFSPRTPRGDDPPDILNLAACIARTGRGNIALHLPEGWHRENERTSLRTKIRGTGPPAAAA